MSRLGPLRVDTVRGEPYEIGGRTLIPVVRIVSWGKAKATIGTRQIGGWCSGFVWIRPLAIAEATADGEHRIPITDVTEKAVRGLLAMALAITFALTTIRWLVGWRCRSRLAS